MGGNNSVHSEYAIDQSDQRLLLRKPRVTRVDVRFVAVDVDGP